VDVDSGLRTLPESDRNLVVARSTVPDGVDVVDDGSDRLFADREGEPLTSDPESFESIVRDARLAAANIEGQGAICESLHESRNGVDFD
jgi:hypothetical protein